MFALERCEIMVMPMYRKLQVKNFENEGPISLSKVFSDVRLFMRLLSTNISHYPRDDLKVLKKDILDLQDQLSLIIKDRQVPDSVREDFQYTNAQVNDKILEIERKMLE